MHVDIKIGSVGRLRTISERILKYDEIKKVEEENKSIGNLEEETIRDKLIEDIMDKIYEYDQHVRQYELHELKKEIYSRGIKIIQVERDSVISTWDALFKTLNTEKEKKKIKFYSEEFRWHLFSFNLLHAKTNEEAKNMFNTQMKRDLYVFYDDCMEAYLIKNAELLTTDDVDRYHDLCNFSQADIYLFDMEKKWVYVMTHESDLGPYFYEVETCRKQS